MSFEYPMEPFRIKMIEPIRATTLKEREKLIEDAHYNVFNLKAEDVLVDLLTDSGTGSMSQEQWAMLMLGDESYAGSRSYYRLLDAVQELTGFSLVLPAHQGRGAEKVFFSVMSQPDQYVLGNGHFDTTTGHIDARGAIPVNFIPKTTLDPRYEAPFKGNMDIDAADAFIGEKGKESCALILLTITNNTLGGQPVSMENIRNVRELADKYQLPFYFDAARMTENAFFIHEREKGYSSKSIWEILKEEMSYVDGFIMSAKKDGLANIGGLITTSDEKIFQKLKESLILNEGFSTYGGLAGRDLDIIAQGLREATDLEYLRYRTGQVAYLGSQMEACGIPMLKPFGGHAVYIDAKAMLPHIGVEEFPAQSITIGLYLEGGVRAVEIGTLLAGRDPGTGKNRIAPLELVRLAIPRRVYTQTHLDHVVNSAAKLVDKSSQMRGMKIEYETEHLRHFTAKLKYI
ncbi:MAG: tryptophanase [bacterium]